MKGKTIYTTVANNCGQVKIEDADAEIARLKQQGGNWIKDFSDFMFVIDEADSEVSNPTGLSSGFCWIVNVENQPL